MIEPSAGRVWGWPWHGLAARWLGASVTFTSITNAWPPIATTATPHLLATGDQILPTVTGMIEINGQVIEVIVIDATRFYLSNHDSTSYGAFTGGSFQALSDWAIITMQNAQTKTVNAPRHGSAWLIDAGLPAVSLSQEEIDEATAQGYQWFNYAMISGGHVYDTWLGDSSYIHIDTAGDAWLISLSFSVPSETGNILRTTATITRFGVFGHGVQGSVQKVVDAACEHIELLAELGNPIGSYGGRDIRIHDVWTNGTRVLVGVVLYTTAAPGGFYDLFSVVEITLSGAGGADGFGLEVSAIEVLGQSATTSGGDGNNNGYYGTLCFGGACWNGSPFNGYPEPIQGYLMGSTWARYACYSSTGQVKAMRLSTMVTWHHWPTDGSETVYEINCNGQTPLLYINHIYISGYYRTGVYLLENNVVVDKLESEQIFYGHQGSYNDGAGWLCPWESQPIIDANGPYGTTYERTSMAWTGSLASHFDNAEQTIVDLDAIVAAFRGRDSKFGNSLPASIGAVSLGLQRIDAHAIGFYVMVSGNRVYGTIRTPLGDKTTALTQPGNLWFAWQRKTGEFAFDTSPICYV